MPVLIFRADADASIGTGHIMRCTALGEYLKNNFTCKLVTNCKIDALLHESRNVFSKVHPLAEEADEIEVIEAITDDCKLILLDGYAFDNSYQKRLKNRGFSIVVIDDILANHTEAEIILNHCGGLTPSDYKAKPSTVFALGPSYTLLRKSFLVPKDERKTVIRDCNCFICFGGADPLNDTLAVIKNLIDRKIFTHLHVVVGAAYQYADELYKYITPFKNISLYKSIDEYKMKGIMEQCSYAIVSGSSVAFEYLAVGGVVWVKMIADNQKYVYRFLVNQNLALSYNAEDIVPEKNYNYILDNQQKFFDGCFDQRLNKLFYTWYFAKQLIIRRAKEVDAQLTWKWANDPEVRMQSYSSSTIPWEEHQIWFSRKANDPSCYYYIFEFKGKPAAQIRFEIDNHEATLSYLTDPVFRTKGIGVWILSKGIEQLLHEVPIINKVIGHVKKINIASQRSFQKLNFLKEESIKYPDSYTYTMYINEHSI